MEQQRGKGKGGEPRRRNERRLVRVFSLRLCGYVSSNILTNQDSATAFMNALERGDPS